VDKTESGVVGSSMFGKEQRKCMVYANVRLFCFIFLTILITDVFGQGTTEKLAATIYR
jgi:hypothetical protein